MPALNIIFAGSGEFGLPTLRALRPAGHNLIQIVSQPDRPAGRGSRLTATPVSAYAASEGLGLIRTSNLNAESLPRADLLIVIAFGQKVAPHTIAPARLGAVNLHASILPRWRGAAPINWAIIAGDRETGNSIIRLAAKMDAGAILAQSRLPIGELDTAGEVHDRLAEDGAALMLEVIEDLAAGRAVEREQDDALATVAPKLSRQAARLDFSRSATELARTIRGLYPWPGCHAAITDPTRHMCNRVTLVRARALSGQVPSAPGSINADHTVSTGDGLLEIVELQPEGKRPMPLAAYRNGHPWAPPLRIDSV